MEGGCHASHCIAEHRTGGSQGLIVLVQFHVEIRDRQKKKK